MRLLGYNLYEQQVFADLDGNRVVVSKDGSILKTRQGNKPTYSDTDPQFCIFEKVENFFTSLFFFAKNSTEKVTLEIYDAQSSDNMFARTWGVNADARALYLNNAIFSWLRKKSKNNIVNRKNQAVAARAHDNLSPLMSSKYSFDTLLNVMKLTLPFDHVVTSALYDSKYFAAALPFAQLDRTDLGDYVFTYYNDKMVEDFKKNIYSTVHIKSKSSEKTGIIYFDKVTSVDVLNLVNEAGFDYAHKVQIGESDFVVCRFPTEEGKEPEEPGASYYPDWQSFLNWYYRQTAKEEVESFDQDSYYEEAEKHMIYKPLSKATHAFTTLPKPLFNATSKALEAWKDKYGDVDAWLSRFMPDYKDYLISEQVDAVALWHGARDNDCSFLLADATGVGKGRSLASIAKLFKIQNEIKQSETDTAMDPLVIYFTESAEINIPDVWRDMKAVRADEIFDPVIITGKRVKFDGLASLTKKEKDELIAADCLPEGKNMILTNYTQMKTGTVMLDWLRRMTHGKDVLFILDETHNGLLPTSNQGKNLRKLVLTSPNAKRNGVVFASATPLRDIRGVDLYQHLLKKDVSFPVVNKVLKKAGISAQEALTTMLAEDGTYLRRDHDLSDIKIEVGMPNEDKQKEYTQELELFSNLMNKVVELNALVARISRNRQADMYDYYFIQFGQEEAVRRVMMDATKKNNVNTNFIRLSRLFINSLKIPQVVDTIEREINDGRKPMITFHSTNEGLINSVKQRELPANFSSTIQLTLDNMVRIKDDNENVINLTETNENVHDLYYDILAESENFAHLPLSPLDELIHRLEGLGIKVAEVTGRSLQCVKGEIMRRKIPDKREQVTRFNSGDVDVLVYNQAGATGGSFHAAAEFKDQRPRSIVEMETPVDIIKYVQSQGRGNRYGQVNSPKILSVMTGLIPEMRILQQRNVKLKKLGASVDGSRSSHPLLMSDMPDLLNTVGDKAAQMIVNNRPDIRRYLGVTATENDGDPTELGNYEGMANKILNYSIVLPVQQQNKLFEDIQEQFNILIDELDRANKNPLKLKEIRYPIELVTSEDFVSRTNQRKVVISQGKYKKSSDGLTAFQVYDILQKVDATEIYTQIGEVQRYIQNNQQLILSPFVPHDRTVQELLENETAQNAQFRKTRERSEKLIAFFDRFRLGASYDNSKPKDDNYQLVSIVGIGFPEEQAFWHNPFNYKLYVVKAGDNRVTSVNLHYFLEKGYFMATDSWNSFANEFSTSFANKWQRNLKMLSNVPVQVLSGDLMSALDISLRNGTGALCLYKTTDGQMHRGIVMEGNKLSTSNFPIEIPNAVLTRIADHRDITGSMWYNRRYTTVLTEDGAKLEFFNCPEEKKNAFKLTRGRITPKKWEVILNNNPQLKKYDHYGFNKYDRGSDWAKVLIEDLKDFRLFCGKRDLQNMLSNE